MNEKYSQRQFSTLTGIARATLQLWAKNDKLSPAIEINGKKFYSDEQKEIALRLYSKHARKNTSPTATDVPEQNDLATIGQPATDKCPEQETPDRDNDLPNVQLIGHLNSIEGSGENESVTPAPMSDNQNEKNNSNASKNSGDLSNGEVSTENILANLPKRKPHNTRDILAKMAGVSSRTFGKVEKIEKLATAEIKAALRARELSIDAAYKGVLAGATTVDEVKEFNRRKFKTPPAPLETFETPTTIELASASKIITLEDRANKIRQLQADVQRGIVEIGFELIAAKKEIGHGGWADWLATNFDWTQQTANRFMRVSERFGKMNNVAQFKPSTLQAMLALPEGDEDKFIEAQSEAGKPVESQSAREVKAAVEDWNQQHNEETNNFSFSRDKTHDSGGGKIAAVVAPYVEEESISEDTSPASPSFDEKPVDVKFKLNAMENFRTWQAFIAKFGETVEENQLNKLINLFGEYWLELGKPFTYEKNLIRIAERILACVKEICKQTADLSAMVKIELRKLNGGDSDD